MVVGDGVPEDWDGRGEVPGSGKTGASDSSRTVGEMACAMALRPEESEEDIRFIMRLARFDFFSDFSSLVEDDEPSVGGGDSSLNSRLV